MGSLGSFPPRPGGEALRALQGHVHNQVADTYLLQFVLPLQDDRHAALRAPQARGSFPTLVSKEGFIGFGLPVLALGLGSRRPAWPPGLGPWSLVPGSASRSTVRRSPSPRQYDIRTQKHIRTYPYLRILKTFSGLPVTYVRTYVPNIFMGSGIQLWACGFNPLLFGR